MELIRRDLHTARATVVGICRQSRNGLPTPPPRSQELFFTPLPGRQAVLRRFVIPQEPVYRRWPAKFGPHARVLPAQDVPAGGPHCAERIRDSIAIQSRPLFPHPRGGAPEIRISYASHTAVNTDLVGIRF